MKPLFLRILAVLLGSFLVITILSFFLFGWISRSTNPGDQHLHDLSFELANDLAIAYAQGDHDEMRKRLHRYRKIRSWILDENNNNLVQPPIPPQIKQQINHYPLIIRPYKRKHFKHRRNVDEESPFIFAHEVGVDETVYKIIFVSNYHPFRMGSRFGLLAFPLFVGLMGLLAASGLLTYWILRPLRILGQTAKSITPDNVSAKIPNDITNRKDAFGELGRDFNAMTIRVEQAISSQQQLLRDVSHELRSPLARIQVAASIALNKGAPTNELERIEKEVERLDSLIEKLLSVSRLQNSFELDTEKLDVVPILSGVINDAGFEFADKNVSVELLGNASATCLGNRELLTSGFENIIRNGFRYSSVNGRVSVLVELIEEKVRISISDQGSGIQQQHVEQIFDPFFREDHSRNISDGHHGVGLALTKSIVKLHNGTISASNISSGGLKVTVCLPRP